MTVKQRGIDVNSPAFGKAIAVYDAASNCLTSAYKENKNNYWLDVFLQNIVTFTLRIIFKCKLSITFRNIMQCCFLFEAQHYRAQWLW